MGYIGLGAMGGALAGRLAGKHRLHVWDLNSQATTQLEHAGAIVAPTAASLARQCNVILLCLPRTEDVRDLIFGPDGLIEGLSAGTVLIDQTSGVPDETREIARRLHEQGVFMLDAPVAGGVPAARDGRITMMVSGPQPAFEQALPVLQGISPFVIRCGDNIGDGQAIKIINNMMNAAARIALLEAVTLGKKLGLPLPALAEAINKSPASSRLSQVALLALLEGRPSTDFALPLMVKDVNQAIALSDSAGAPLPLVSLSRSILELGVNKMGPASRLEDMIEFIASMADTTLADHARVAPVVTATEQASGTELIKSTLDACNQLIVYEAIALAIRIRLDLGHLAEVINKGTGWTQAFDRIMAAVHHSDHDADADLANMARDLALTSQLAFAHRAPMLIANTAGHAVRALQNELGDIASLDSILQLFKIRAGLRE